MPMRKNRVDKLNLLRIIAFLCVFLLHSKIFIPVKWNKNVNCSWILFTPAWAGVWIFIILSGYGIGSGFENKKYDLTFNGVIRFYITRLIKIIPLYWTYLLFVSVFIKPDILLPSVSNLKKIFSLMFFNYQEEFYSVEYGLSWYLTTLMRLYLVSPIIYYFIEKKINTDKKVYIFIVLLLISFLILRLMMKYHISKNGGDWSASVYKPFYFNLDIYIIGFLLPRLKGYIKMKPNIALSFFSFFSLIALLIYNSKIYYDASYKGYSKGWDIYCYILPTIYAVIVSIYIVAFDIKRDYDFTLLDSKNLSKNPFRFIDFFPQIQMPMYLFHSTVLLCMQQGYNNSLYSKYMKLLNVSKNHYDFWKGTIFTIFSLFYTCILAVIIKNITNKRQSIYLSNVLNKDYKRIYNKIKIIFVKILGKIFPYKNIDK